MEEMIWIPSTSPSKILESDFKEELKEWLEPQCLDVIKFEVCGYGYPDLLIVPKFRCVMFFIELKGKETGYDKKLQPHQDDFYTRYNNHGITVLRLCPDDDWQGILKDYL